MKPLKNFILVAEAEVENKTESGLIITGGSIESGSKPGVAVAIGPDVESVAVGDTIACKWGDGLPVTVKGQKGVLLPEDAIYAIY